MNNDGDGDSDGSDCEFVIDSQFSAETREAYECCEDAFECSLCKNEDGIKHRRVDVENEVWTKCDQVRLHIHTEICADVLFVTEQKLPFVRLLDLYWECKELQRSIRIFYGVLTIIELNARLCWIYQQITQEKVIECCSHVTDFLLETFKLKNEMIDIDCFCLVSLNGARKFLRAFYSYVNTKEYKKNVLVQKLHQTSAKSVVYKQVEFIRERRGKPTSLRFRFFAEFDKNGKCIQCTECGQMVDRKELFDHGVHYDQYDKVYQKDDEARLRPITITEQHPDWRELYRSIYDLPEGGMLPDKVKLTVDEDQEKDESTKVTTPRKPRTTTRKRSISPTLLAKRRIQQKLDERIEKFRSDKRAFHLSIHSKILILESVRNPLCLCSLAIMDHLINLRKRFLSRRIRILTDTFDLDVRKFVQVSGACDVIEKWNRCF